MGKKYIEIKEFNSLVDNDLGDGVYIDIARSAICFASVGENYIYYFSGKQVITIIDESEINKQQPAAAMDTDFILKALAIVRNPELAEKLIK